MAMKGAVFMAWLDYRLTPALRERVGLKNMTLELDNAPHHHNFHPEIKVPGSDTKLCNANFCRALT